MANTIPQAPIPPPNSKMRRLKNILENFCANCTNAKHPEYGRVPVPSNQLLDENDDEDEEEEEEDEEEDDVT